MAAHVIVPELCSTGNEFQELAWGRDQELGSLRLLQRFCTSAPIGALHDVERSGFFAQNALSDTASTSLVNGLLAYVR